MLIATATLDPAFPCVCSPLGIGSLAHAREAIYGSFGNSLRRFHRADGGASDPNWLRSTVPSSLTLRHFDDRVFVHGCNGSLGSEQRRSLAALPTIER